MYGNLIEGTLQWKASLMPRSYVKCQIVPRSLMLRRVETKPVEFSSSDKNVI